MGKCNIPKPGFFDFEGQRKWQVHLNYVYYFSESNVPTPQCYPYVCIYLLLYKMLT